MQGLFREQLEEVRYDLTVAGAGVFAALCDLVIAHEDDAAVLAALDERAAVAKAGERQLLAKDAALVHAFKHGAVAVGVQAQKRRAAREQHADHILLLSAGEDGLSCAEALLVSAEAAQHIFARCFVHTCKQCGIAAVHRSPSRKACCFTGAAQPLTYCIIIYQRGKKVNDNFAKKSDKKACDPCKKASALFGGCFFLGFARIVVKHLRNGR